MNDGIEQTKRQGERNPAAPLQQRLRNHAKAAGDDVSLVLIRYLNERFPSTVKYSKRLIERAELEAYKTRTQPDGTPKAGRPRKL